MQTPKPRPNGQRDAGGSGQAERRRFAISTAIALVGVAAAVVTPLYQGSKPATSEDHLAQCRDAHNLPATPNTQNPDRPGTFHYEDCSWPPVLGADPDGHFAITLQRVGLAGKADANEFTDVLVITTRCAAILVQSKFSDQGTEVEDKPLTLANDQVVSIWDGSPAPFPSDVASQIGSTADGRLLVLYHERLALTRIACANPPG